MGKSPRSSKANRPTVGRPPKHADRDASGRTGAPVSVRIDPHLRALIPVFQQHFKAKNGVTPGLTDVIELALTNLYREAGILPPELDQSKRS